MIVKELFAKLGLDVDEGAFSAAEAAMSGVKGGLVAIGAALGGMAVGFAAMVRSTSNAGDNLDELSARTGVNAQALQRLGYGASFAGVGFDELAIAMNFLAKKGSKDVEKDLGKIADRVKALTDQGRGPEAAAYAIEKLGRQGARLVPFLKEGSAGLAKMGEEAEALGYVMSAETIKASAEFNDSIDRLGHAWTGLRNDVIGPLLPMLTRVAGRILDWFKANRELIKQKITQAVQAFLTVCRALWAALTALGKVLHFVVENWKIFAAVVGGIALAALLANIGAVVSAIGWYAALGVAAVLAGLKAAAAWAAAAAPVVILGLLLAAIALAAEDVYVFLKGGDSLIGDIGPKWTKFLDGFLKPEDDDWWLTKALKVALRVLTDLQSTWQFLTGEMTSAKFFGDVLGLKQSGPPASNEKPDVGFIGRMFNAIGAQPSYGGIQAVPGRPADPTPMMLRSDLQPRAAGPTMNVGGVTVNVKNGEPSEVRAAVVDAFEDMWRGKMGAALPAVSR